MVVVTPRPSGKPVSLTSRPKLADWRASIAPALLALVAGCSSGTPPVPTTPSAATAVSNSPSATPPNKEDIAPEAATGLRQVQEQSGQHSMVAAANPHAAKAGQQMLQAGGSAVDAAVAMALMLTLVEPQSSGIGGGAFMLHYDAADKKVRAYDGRETAPAAADPRMFLNAQGKPKKFFDAVLGGLSIGVPGELRMLELAHKKHGKLPWNKLFEPAIERAEKGFAISPRLHKLLAWDRHLAAMKVAGKYFYKANGTPKPVGTVLRNQPLADTFRAIAKDGAEAFYQGDIARDIVSAAQQAKNKGRISEQDLKGYRAIERSAVCRPYRAFEVCGMPPPTSGGVTMLQILGMLEHFPVSKHDADAPANVHLLAEASRLAFADRGLYLADPDFVKVPVAGLLDPGYLKQRARLISSTRSLGEATAGSSAQLRAHYWAADASREVPATSHFVAVDKQGHVVSMTASIESAFGSHVMTRGFLLNNELTDFSFVPNKDGKPVANRVEAHKRPRSSMAPIIVLNRADRSFHLAIGSPGGSRIIGYVARVLVATLDHGIPLQDAISAPHFTNRNGATELEKMPGHEAWLSTTERALKKLGHRVKVRAMNSGLHGVMRTPKALVGAADPRREGVVLSD